MHRLIGFGDSIIYGSNLERSWLYQLLERFSVSPITYTPAWPWTWYSLGSDPPISHRNDYWYESVQGRIYNMGVGGDTTGGMVTRFATDVLSDPTITHCMILGGINDIAAGVSTTTITNNLDSLYEACLSNGIVPVPCTLLPYPWSVPRGAKTAAQIRADIATVNGWITTHIHDYIDFYSVINADATTLLNADDVHPTQAGYDAMAASIDLGDLGIGAVVDITPDPAPPTERLHPLQFTATITDHLGQPVTASPVWSCTGGTITQDGLWTAPDAGGLYAITATYEGASDTVVVEVDPNLYLHADTARELVPLTYSEADTVRELMALTWADADTARALIDTEYLDADTLRQLTEAVWLLADTARPLTATEYAEFDMLRRFVYVVISGASISAQNGITPRPATITAHATEGSPGVIARNRPRISAHVKNRGVS